ncbi:e3 ubiquitin-protein ligase RNF38 [Trichonephila inaurata madagascariensis]|uniref:E3 ubiquitin-protein ligase RNF38 n=1 Tax=Trichonephila inaurata madagascariensis TaxID=2747483 RepID=A0A8X6YT96_9ARAC|nr:e3 ubiquitin-protein ligase RNF38 [Trichonephila inaurata madagascariensis]
MATFQDDSTDDEIGVNLQLAERLSINKGDHVSSKKNIPNSKALKQLHNYSKKNLLDYKSSSSSSLDMHLDQSAMEGPSSYGLHNKKRQNGDKNIEQFSNSKRTCFGDRLLRSPDWEMNNDNSSEMMHFSSKPTSSFSKNLYPDKTYEDHLRNLSDDDDSDFRPRRAFNSKNISQPSEKYKKFIDRVLSKRSKNSNMHENQPSGSNSVQFVDSTSDDDSRSVMQNGALKGGRQSPEFSLDKKRWNRKVTKVLDSDSDDLQVEYRSRPIIFSSSSDSEDDRPKEKINKKSNSMSKKSANPSFPSGMSHNSDHSYYMRDAAAHQRFNGAGSSRQYAPHVSSSSDYQIKNPTTKSYKSSNKVHSSNGMCRPFSPLRNEFSGFLRGANDTGTHKPHSVSPSSSQPRTIYSRHTSIRKSPKNTSGTRYQNRLPRLEGISTVDMQNFPTSEVGPYRGRDRNHSTRSSVPHPVVTRSHHRSNNRKSYKGRSVHGACSQETKNNLASIYPDLFDAEDSSEVEFFTANSYSDNESNTESLNNMQVNPMIGNGPAPQSEDHKDNPVNLASSEDEISVVFTSAPRQQTPEQGQNSRTLGRMCTRCPRGYQSPSQNAVSLSPDPVEQVRQVEDDERFARRLQAQFDAETDPNYMPCRQPLTHFPHTRESTSSDDDSSLDLQMDNLPVTRISYDHLNLNPLLRGIQVRLARAPFYHVSGRPNARSRRRIGDFEQPFLHWNSISNNSIFNFDTEDNYEAFLGLAELTGEVTRGLQRAEINRLPTRKYTIPCGASTSSGAEVPHKRAELNKECQVCLNDYVNGDVLRILPCFHEFHTPCIDPWLKINHTCPVCRVVVNLDE